MLLPIAVFLISLTTGTPIPDSNTRCGSKDYTASQIFAAADAACSHIKSGNTAGSSTYPHRYNDREGFTFTGVDGPYYEFPLLSSGKIYNGGIVNSANSETLI